MKLTRRDALAALASAGVVGGGSAAVFARDRRERNETDPLLDALVATAEVVYPSEVSGVPAFVEAYSRGRLDSRPEYRSGVRGAVAELDDRAQTWYGEEYTSLAPSRRDDLLREMGVHTADEDPEGTTAERVRFYVVDELLFALYTSPTGGRLVGIENPQGHPGGVDSYQRGPP